MNYSNKYSRPGKSSSRFSSSNQQYGQNEKYPHRPPYPISHSSAHDIAAPSGMTMLHPPDFNSPPPTPYGSKYPPSYKRPPLPQSSVPPPHCSYYPPRPPVKKPNYGHSSRHQQQPYSAPSGERKFIPPGSSRERHSDAAPRNKYKSQSYEPYQSTYSKDNNVKQYASSRPERSVQKPRDYRDKEKRVETERDRLLSKWRSNYCETSEDITRKLEQLANNEEKEYWIRSSPADIFYKRTSDNEMEGTNRLEAVCKLFKEELVDRGKKATAKHPPAEIPSRKRRQRVCRHKCKISGYFEFSWFLIFFSIFFLLLSTFS